MTRIAPQAYTKEVLASAFDWLSRQPEHIKKSIRTSDDLVGLYLKSTRLKEGRPSSNLSQTENGSSADLSSAKSFRNELQGLALNLKQFEDKPEEAPASSSQVSSYLHELNLMMNTQADGGSSTATNSSVNHGKNLNSDYVKASTPELAKEGVDAVPIDNADTVLLKLDKKTMGAINLAKERLNLSSNTEAIRVLVSLGEKHLKKVFGSED